jgi:hypothetical protein
VAIKRFADNPSNWITSEWLTTRKPNEASGFLVEAAIRHVAA